MQFVFDNKTNVLHVATRFMAEATSSLDGIPGPLMPRCRIRGQVLVYHIACRRSIVTVNQFCRFCIRANAFPNKWCRSDNIPVTFQCTPDYFDSVLLYSAIFYSLVGPLLTHVETTSQETKWPITTKLPVYNYNYNAEGRDIKPDPCQASNPELWQSRSSKKPRTRLFGSIWHSSSSEFNRSLNRFCPFCLASSLSSHPKHIISDGINQQHQIEIHPGHPHLWTCLWSKKIFAPSTFPSSSSPWPLEQRCHRGPRRRPTFRQRLGISPGAPLTCASCMVNV